jgi:chlorophyll synthase
VADKGLLFNQFEPLILTVPILPFYMGLAFATGSLAPYDFKFLIAFIAIFPFLGTSTLLLNDIHDMKVDPGSKRKAGRSLETGSLSQKKARGWIALSMAASLLLAWFVNTHFLITIAGLHFLSWIYSTPPARLTSRPVLDLAANVLGIGVLCNVAGWVAAAPGTCPPVAWLYTSGMGAGVAFIMLAAIDVRSDAAGGKKTTVVWLGESNGLLLGLGLLFAANLGIMYLAKNAILLTRSFLYIALPFIALETATYILLMSRPKSLGRGYIWIIGELAFGNLLILLNFGGILLG